MWLVEDMGAEKFRQTVSKYIGYDLKPGKHVKVSSLSHRKCKFPEIAVSNYIGYDLKPCKYATVRTASACLDANVY